MTTGLAGFSTTIAGLGDMVLTSSVLSPHSALHTDGHVLKFREIATAAADHSAGIPAIPLRHAVRTDAEVRANVKYDALGK